MPIMKASIELIASGVVAVLAAIGELYRRGKLSLFGRKHGPKKNGMHNGDRNKLDEIHDTVLHVDEKVNSIEEKTDRNAYLIRQFHGDEQVDVPVERILDDDKDFYRGGGRPDGD